MKSFLVVVALLAGTTVTLAETYKWEDESGMHFTDNLQSVPAKLRAKVQAEAAGETPAENQPAVENTAPAVGEDSQRRAGSAAREGAAEPYCPPGRSYSHEGYLSLVIEHQDLEKKCRELIRERDNLAHLINPNAADRRRLGLLAKDAADCVTEMNKAGDARHRYYSCGRNVGGVALKD